MRNYIKAAVSTESNDFQEIWARLEKPKIIRILHAGMGLSTESGELLDALKKYIYYGKKLDEVNLQEEMGDIFWYCAILADALGVSFTEVMLKNLAKLKARYPKKFRNQDALMRNLDLERKILEGK